MSPDLPDLPAVPVKCVCYDSQAQPCVCLPTERVLRWWSQQGNAGCNLMTAAQREWCLDEIASVEGYKREDYELQPDADVARDVLNAWRDYCRDKGMI